MLWGDTTAETMRRVFDQAKAHAERARRLDAEHRLDILHDDWRDILRSYVSGRYSANLYKEIEPHISTEHNLLKRVTTDLAQVYKWGATRELSDPRENDKAKLLWDEMQIDEALEQANQYLVALRDLILLPLVIDGVMTLEILTPDQLNVIQHPGLASRAAAFWFTRCTSSNTGPGLLSSVYRPTMAATEIVLVDDMYYRVFDVNYNLLEEVEHGCGRLPCVVVHAEKRTDSFFRPTVFGDVVEATKTVGWLLSALSYMQKMQAELQLTYQGDPDDVAQGQAIGAHALLAGRGGFQTLDLQADPSKYLAHINARISLVSLNHGLGTDGLQLTSASSGMQFRIQRMPLLEARRKQIKKWHAVEIELHRVIAMISQRFHPLVKLDPTSRLSVQFNNPEFAEDPAVQNEVDNDDVANMRASEIDVLMRRNPDLTREQAIERQKQIIKERDQVLGWKAARNTSGALGAGEGKTAEQNGREGGTSSGATRRGEPDLTATAARLLQQVRAAR